MMNPESPNGHSGKQLGGVTGKGFMPGQSGNPKGRPRGSGITDRLRELLQADDGRLQEILLKSGVKAAAEGDFRFWKEIYDRMDGTVEESLILRQAAAPTLVMAFSTAEPPEGWYRDVRELIGYERGDPLLPGETEADVGRLPSS
jgi:hypothetical protein